ncbi:bifunctional 23S rRNA (guanine(2069)-N(7))-methyltransferase RlmK/23S rRNA (guanine(2445)-N(2))-methyltransferase RlmL [Cellvibrio japonicus]|uniref:Ribosomal RNA large subunit methyltransferase K/L n=1 Tax=Cellvibrio japonicus (strain Ueda107) TaxID=498211 RepID=RLMKL_CELJU|nr:bifunctional 23S rRNA (guanine(2069)-N(7))-methyltransferase RlmK/23S rRNA (guanine(2445)-N(2))-methyltransferase RlmL [Cellvibrio japonicus]B3PIL6.1 RecName: Full=Ribosomal RNA large subunit methyltransferase K/L; Includes: RecName: Full=23S rRNA m2G2445 methyltransferase; AltName: Full=rRNA (guanine-N(2)-)-methyltransferase RlmL; Includes: RecName: Full=23S rRNA m7G2069 methyltransferase; AltName: Full=rRNA (guanine-N(7)-)-methyltransferase RlmK [Cellvibrio japonicus Ueda107]ACE83336.1 Putat
MIHQYFAACPKGLEGLLLQELQALGATDTRETIAGVYFNGDLNLAYRTCLWSRLANKILLPLANFEVNSQEDLYEGVRMLPWQDHLSPSGSLLVDFVGTNDAIRNTQFGALKVKDAIVDCLRDFSGVRPNIAKRDPDLLVNARLSKNKLVLSIDLSGESLHRRGYRLKQGSAPLKENLAAGILIRAGWPEVAAQGGALLDPMCGSGTFLVEAALMAADIAPGLGRASFGFERWLNHRNDLWLTLREEAHHRRKLGLAKVNLPEIRGYDADVRVVRAAEENIISAELDHWLRVSRKELAEFKKPTHRAMDYGLVLSNPPYGERLGEIESLKLLYAHLGERLRNEFPGWRAGVFTGNPELGKQMGLRADKKYKFFNGTIASELLMFSINTDVFVQSRVEQDGRFSKDEVERDAAEQKVKAAAKEEQAAALSNGAQMLVNRLQKNRKQLEKWARKNEVSCYRLYDADMPEYAAAIDLYLGQTPPNRAPQLYAHVQEYAAPKSVDEARAAQRFADIEAAVPYALDIPVSHISYKQRRRNKGSSQYEKLNERPTGDLFSVQEGQAKLHINLWQYLDTGLFLDHRPVRHMIANMARDKRFLNLFCYTATASVHAAMGGARYTVSVDMSNTYLNWARKNFALNGLSEARNRLEQADCLKWLENNDQQFDLILLDPPSFSNSKRMEDILDIQRDHVEMIHNAMRSLSEEGTLIFSNNLRNFKLDLEALGAYNIEDISARTIDEDFKRNPKIHQCWLIRH